MVKNHSCGSPKKRQKTKNWCEEKKNFRDGAARAGMFFLRSAVDGGLAQLGAKISSIHLNYCVSS